MAAHLRLDFAVVERHWRSPKRQRYVLSGRTAMCGLRRNPPFASRKERSFAECNAKIRAERRLATRQQNGFAASQSPSPLHSSLIAAGFLPGLPATKMAPPHSEAEVCPTPASGHQRHRGPEGCRPWMVFDPLLRARAADRCVRAQLAADAAREELQPDLPLLRPEARPCGRRLFSAALIQSR